MLCGAFLRTQMFPSWFTYVTTVLGISLLGFGRGCPPHWCSTAADAWALQETLFQTTSGNMFGQVVQISLEHFQNRSWKLVSFFCDTFRSALLENLNGNCFWILLRQRCLGNFAEPFFWNTSPEAFLENDSGNVSRQLFG